jgi:hypothetical protein
MDEVPTHTITLEKAGLYRGKQRYTIAEIPELGTSVAPEVDAARWLLLRRADPDDTMLLKYPKSCGYVLELPRFREDSVLATSFTYREWEMSLAEASHLYRCEYMGRPDRLVSEEEYEANGYSPTYPQLATKQNDKIGQETRKQLRRQGILTEDYFDKWRNERAAELQAQAARWEAGEGWLPYAVWKGGEEDRRTYRAAMAALLRWQADRVLHDLDPGDRVELRAKEIELGLTKQSKFEEHRIEKGRTLVEACGDWWAKKDTAEAAKAAPRMPARHDRGGYPTNRSCAN